ncbi:hypothetical protein ASPWEDRAFT_45469 [Aspergillus wentii DTO 134E9]|uniref:Uncharacterized protein n=1 Tax=Aspergillus wentii DTO 134E9 TaxID=1073089 RepID=A0A1L9R9C6_ASPWE|nr:uncharacterized protein ASPWEDRAFT_45469 [Aspergillus wentii DTO 134E9]KAI9926439.1 hypothetical protein MW887_004204 [Aspergillus wentii]OJJ31524.1 hypothetical protein ASPWEDRAFT_45469 [Aspergillus wentii DTO 134E9]
MISVIATKLSSLSVLDLSLNPQTPDQWRLALQGVKLLYFQRQYKQCAARSAEILKTASEPIHPVYKTYLYFYSAISYEILGRSAHNYSTKKLHLLHSALDCFVTCTAVLPSAISASDAAEESSPASLVDFSSPSDSSESPSTVGSLVSSITRIIDNSIECSEEDPFVSGNDPCLDSAGTLPFKLPDDDPKAEQLLPSPLRIRKSSGDLSSVVQTMFETDNTTKAAKAANRISLLVRFSRPPPLPIRIVPAGDRKGHSARTEIKIGTEESLKFLSTDVMNVHGKSTPTTPSHKKAILHYNDTIHSLAAQINASIADIHSLIDEVTEMQRARRASRNLRRSASFWSFSPVKEESHKNDSPTYSGRTVVKETKEQRIARLRADGWSTVGLKSCERGWKGTEYYQAYCNSILDELYLDM